MEQQVEKALQLLEALVKKTGATVEQFYPVFVKQVVVEAWTSMAEFGLAGLLIGIGGVLLLREGQKSRDDEVKVVTSVLAIITLGVSVGLIVGGVIGNIPSLVNPDYFAAKKILLLLKP